MSALRPHTRVPVPARFGPEWANALTGWLQRLVQEMQGGDVEVGGDLITEAGRVENLRATTTSPDNASIFDEVIDCNFSGAGQVNLPPAAALKTGKKLVIQDSSGNASLNNITISGNGSNINGASSVAISTDYGRRTCRWNGTEWIA